MLNYTTKVILFKVAKLMAVGASACLTGAAFGALAPKQPQVQTTDNPVAPVEPAPETVDVEFTEVNGQS